MATQLLLAAAVMWYAFRALEGQWDAAGAGLRTLDIGWGWIAAASVVVVLTYLLLIETWRKMLMAWSARLPFAVASRIWFVSNLGKYVPGKIWSIAAMSMMARDNAVSPVAATGSSILIQIVTITAGIGVVLATGAQTVDRPVVAGVVVVALLTCMAVTPFVLPAIAMRAASLVGKDIIVPPMKSAAIWAAFVRATVAWIAYGIGFQLFVKGVLGSAAGATTSYIAVYAASYIIGFLALFAPGGAVVREGAMVAGLLRLGISGEADALTIALASRLWLTVLELVPGLAYLAIGRRGTSLTN
ncbi:MAG: lysylphosphatidylglycerol synthase domain-containing protein [Gemmatimonadaceae bacterium]